MRNKYGNKKVVSPDGLEFDSRKEYNRWYELKLLERAGKIKKLRRQVKYVLIPAQHEEQYKKLLERECAYVADFVYWDNELGQEVVEDTKGVRTAEYKIKRKLMLFKYGIRIKET